MKEITYHFCNKGGHFKKDCLKYTKWCIKKGKLLALVSSEINLAFIPRDTWWVDSSVITHISVFMQGCLWS